MKNTNTHLSPEDYKAIDDYRPEEKQRGNYYSAHGDYEGAILCRQEEEAGSIE